MKFSKDIANKTQNKKVVVIPPTKYSQAIVNHHAKWTMIKHDKQAKILEVQGKTVLYLQAKELRGGDIAVKLAKIKSKIEIVKFEHSKPIKYKLNNIKRFEYGNNEAVQLKDCNFREAL
jgi:hypothetical protein